MPKHKTPSKQVRTSLVWFPDKVIDYGAYDFDERVFHDRDCTAGSKVEEE